MWHEPRPVGLGGAEDARVLARALGVNSPESAGYQVRRRFFARQDIEDIENRLHAAQLRCRGSAGGTETVLGIAHGHPVRSPGDIVEQQIHGPSIFFPQCRNHITYP